MRKQTLKAPLSHIISSQGKIWPVQLFSLEIMVIFQRILGFPVVKEEDQSENWATHISLGTRPSCLAAPCVNTASGKKYVPPPTCRALFESQWINMYKSLWATQRTMKLYLQALEAEILTIFFQTPLKSRLRYQKLSRMDLWRQNEITGNALYETRS